MSLKLEKKGYIKKDLNCPNCNTSIALYLDDEEKVRKAYLAKILEDGKLECEICESILSYQPESKSKQK